MSKNFDINLEIDKFIYDPLFSDKKHVCISAGRRVGKTYNTAMWFIGMLLSKKNSMGLWVDTVQRNIPEYADLYFKKILGDLWNYCKYHRQEQKLVFPNNSIIHFRSAERPELMEGFEYDFVVLNEAGIILKKESLWTNTIQPMCKNGVVRIVGTPKGFNFFKTLFDELPRISPNEWASYRFEAKDSPHWTHEQIQEIKKITLPEIWEQEYLGKFVQGKTFAVINKSFKESWRDDSDTPYDFEHPFIQQQLKDRNGYYFASFDGGMDSNTNACVIGFYNTQFSRCIILKEIYSEYKKEDSHFIAMKASDFISKKLNVNIRDVKLYGDPALEVYKDDDSIKSVFGSSVNMLTNIKTSSNNEIAGLYRNRKTARLGVLKREVSRLRADNLPAVILLRGEKEKIYNQNSFGCYNLYEGLFENAYRFEVKDASITKDLEQNHPVVDICDALSYYLLETHPLDSQKRTLERKHLKLRGFTA